MKAIQWDSARAWVLTALVGVVLTTLALERAEAQWHLDLQAGAFIPASDIELFDGFDDFDGDVDTGGAFVVGGGYRLGRWVDFTSQLQTATNFDLYDDNVDVYSFTIGGRVFPLSTAYRFRPWLGAQIGWYRVDANVDAFFDDDDDFSEGDDSFGLNAGGGFDIPINHRVSLGLDVRYHNAFDAFQGFEFVTTMFNVSIWFGNEPAPPSSSDTPPVPRNW